MELVQDLTIPLSQSCHSMLFAGGWLFVGLWDGSVRAYNQEGTDCILEGHSKKVTSLVVHQAVLISGSVDREVRLWQMNPQNRNWVCTHTISESMPGPINRLHVLGDNLFVAGMNGLAMCNLVSLTVTKILPPTKSVADLLEFEHHLIVAYADGGLRIFDAEGTLKKEVPSLKAGPILSLAGLESGPRVLVGHNRGQVTTITLPSFEFKTQFQAMDSTRVDSIRCAGHDGIFLLGGSNGNLQLWQRLGG